MDKKKTHVIACADAWLKDAGQPTYTELLKKIDAMTNPTGTEAVDLDKLEVLAKAADQGEGQHIYIHWRDANNWEANLAWHNAASPAAFLALIALSHRVAPDIAAQPDTTASASGEANCTDGGKCGIGGYCKDCPYAAPSWDHEEALEARASLAPVSAQQGAADAQAMPGDWTVELDRYSAPGTIRLNSPKWGGCFLREPKPGDIALPAIIYRLLADMLEGAAKAPTAQACTCVYATSENTESVRKGYEMGGYVKEECAACKAQADHEGDK